MFIDRSFFIRHMYRKKKEKQTSSCVFFFFFHFEHCHTHNTSDIRWVWIFPQNQKFFMAPSRCPTILVTNLSGTRDQFCGRQFFFPQNWERWEMVQAVIWTMGVMGNGEWSFPYLPAAHLLIWVPGVEDPCPTM